jgi:hypothetical protein
VRLAVPDVFAENGDDLGIGLGVEVVTSLDKDVLEFLVYFISLHRMRVSSHHELTVGDDTV